MFAAILIPLKENVYMLKGETQMQLIPVKSSNIKSAGYENGVIRVRFGNGTEYDYAGADVKTFNDFMEAKSQGKFFHQNIRGKLTGTKVTKEDGNG